MSSSRLLYASSFAAAGLAVLVACGARSSASVPASAGDLALDVTLPESYAQVSDIVELQDGRIAFTDRKARVFNFGDFAKQTVTVVGQKVDTVPAGAPPSVYKFPGAVLHLAADTLALVDFAALRTTLFTEKGEAIAAVGLIAAGGNTPVLYYDSQGHGYKVDYQAVLGGGEPGRSVRTDSVSLLRLWLNLSKADTVAQLSAPVYGEARFGEQVQQVAKVFSPNDVFGVLADGTVWVARGSKNSVDWRTPDGKWTTGAPRDYEKLPVTADDKERVMARLRERGMPANVTVSFPFADTKPPFDAGYSRPNGEVWLQRSRRDDQQQMVYDVYAKGGAWQRTVTLPSGIALAGFGATAIYATAKQPDGTRKIGRYTLK
jgi:hypothetical protein